MTRLPDRRPADVESASPVEPFLDLIADLMLEEILEEIGPAGERSLRP